MAQKYFTDVDDRGRIINDSHRGQTLASRVRTAVSDACSQVINRTGGQIHVRAQSYSRDHAADMARRMMDRKVKDMMDAVYVAAENEVYSFIWEGNRTVGRFPEVDYPCFSSTKSGDLHLRYFERLRFPDFLAKNYWLGRKLLHKRSILGGTVVRLLLLLVGFLGFAAMAALTDICFPGFAQIIRQVIPGESAQKMLIILSWILGLGSYGLHVHKFRKKRTGEESGCLPTALLYFLLVMAVFHGGFYPIEAGFPDDMLLLYLMGQLGVSVLYFTIRLLMEIWDLVQGLSLWVVKLNCRLHPGKREFCEKLVTLYNLWFKNAGFKNVFGPLRELNEMLEQVNRWCGIR